jgi:hypothetical protein
MMARDAPNTAILFFVPIHSNASTQEKGIATDS